MNDIEFRKFQEAATNMALIMPETVKALYSMYSNCIKTGFTKKELLDLVKTFIATLFSLK